MGTAKLNLSQISLDSEHLVKFQDWSRDINVIRAEKLNDFQKIDNFATAIQSQVDAIPIVSASSIGTSSESIRYITINGEEKLVGSTWGNIAGTLSDQQDLENEFQKRGIPSGGIAEQVIVKTNNSDYSFEWRTPRVSGIAKSETINEIKYDGKDVLVYGATNDKDGNELSATYVKKTAYSPDTASQSMTQPVGADLSGKLWTIPPQTLTWEAITGKPSTLENYGISASDSLLEQRVKVAQGTAHAGEFLVVGADGNVTTQVITTIGGGSY